jgi:glutathione-specific gamma-glutamylcyclotransferase
VTQYLDIREQNGYSVEFTTFYYYAGDTRTSKTLRCLVYIGLPSNPQFVGPQDPQVLAEHILRSKGPSGENVEYLLNLEEALRELCPLGENVKSIDFHVNDLARRCRELMVGREKKSNVSGQSERLNIVESNEDELEEVEK